MMRNLIRSTITAWTVWRARRAMRKAYPELRDLDIQLAKEYGGCDDEKSLHKEVETVSGRTLLQVCKENSQRHSINR